ncbi:MAG: hypothetical protein Q4C91_01810 [Eubacteriales bacterium]|nr:hypothetical protein [Eubacteriales bacterium]
MKNMKKYFKMMITAVICLAMSLIPGKNVKADVMTVLSGGQAVSNNTERSTEYREHLKNAALNMQRRIVNTERLKQGSYIKKIFYWLQGPGDREAGANSGSGVIQNQTVKISYDSG